MDNYAQTQEIPSETPLDNGDQLIPYNETTQPAAGFNRPDKYKDAFIPPPDSKYDFAKPIDELARVLAARRDEYRELALRTGLLNLWRRSFNQFNNGLLVRGRILRTGSQAHLREMSVNDYRNILQHIRVMGTNSKPAFEVGTQNMDTSSTTAAVLSPYLLEHYLYHGDLGGYRNTTADIALWSGIGFLETFWNYTKGDFYMTDPETGEPLYKGDVDYRAYSPFDVAYPLMTGTSTKDLDWVILIEYCNKHDLAALYPEHADAIRNAGADDRYRYFFDNDYFLGSGERISADYVACHRFYHRRCPSLPEGRMSYMVGDSVICSDRKLPYRFMPVSIFCPSKVDKTNIGYSVGFDMLTLQRAGDITFSTMLTNISTFGVQNIMGMKGVDINPMHLVGDLNYIEYSSPQGKPEPLQLVSVPPVVPQFFEVINKKKEDISGVNSTVRGNPPPSLESGSALAMMSSQAIQFNSDFQDEATRVLESTGLHTLEILRVEAQVPRLTGMVGKIPGQLVKDFQGSDLEGVSRVIVRVGNPLMMTTAGRSEIANQLLKMGIIKDTESYLQVLTTGRLEPLISPNVMDDLRRDKENEMLLKGNVPQVLWTDNHPKDIMHHASILSLPEVRKSDAISRAVYAHIDEHMVQWTTGTPQHQGIMQVLGIPPPMPMPQPGAAPPPIGAPPGQGAPVSPNGKGMGPGAPPPPGPLPPMPARLPDNPQTGQEFNFVNGGMPKGGLV